MSEHGDPNPQWAWLSDRPLPFTPFDATQSAFYERLLLWTALILVIITTAFPGLDLGTTRIFYDEGFRWTHDPVFEVFRHTIWRISILLLLVALAGLACHLAGRSLLQVPARLWGFIASLYLIGPGLIVNVGLKSHWGRARPAHIVEFGGDASFTRALVATDQCARNCSFVSGEAAGAVALAISLYFLTRLMPDSVLRKRIRQWTLALTALAAFLRIVTGRHFLSDVLFAALIVCALAFVLSHLFRLWERPQ